MKRILIIVGVVGCALGAHPFINAGDYQILVTNAKKALTNKEVSVEELQNYVSKLGSSDAFLKQELNRRIAERQLEKQIKDSQARLTTLQNDLNALNKEKQQAATTVEQKRVQKEIDKKGRVEKIERLERERLERERLKAETSQEVQKQVTFVDSVEGLQPEKKVKKRVTFAPGTKGELLSEQPEIESPLTTANPAPSAQLKDSKKLASSSNLLLPDQIASLLQQGKILVSFLKNQLTVLGEKLSSVDKSLLASKLKSLEQSYNSLNEFNLDQKEIMVPLFCFMESLEKEIAQVKDHLMTKIKRSFDKLPESFTSSPDNFAISKDLLHLIQWDIVIPFCVLKDINSVDQNLVDMVTELYSLIVRNRSTNHSPKFLLDYLEDRGITHKQLQ